MKKSERLPVVDLGDYLSEHPTRRAAFVRSLGLGLEELGFVAVQGHGIPPELLDAGYAAAAAAFALPQETKRRYATPGDGHQRGYTPFGLERARDNPTPDLKEFWHVGRTLPDDHPDAATIPPNHFPVEIPTFAPAFSQLFDAFEAFALLLLDAITAHLHLPDALLRSMVRDGNSVLRVINYPDLGLDVPPGAVRAAAHEDINLLTVLPASTRPGLELLTREGDWVAVQTPPNVMICDTGDMMQLLTRGRLPSTTHRVVNPEGADGGRMSMPFFLHPRADAVLNALRGEDEAPIRTHDYLVQRLRENGVI